MADQAQVIEDNVHPALIRPKRTAPPERTYDHQLDPAAPTPDPASVKVDGFDFIDNEYWFRGAVHPIFKRMREECPVNYVEESFVGPYWNVTRYADIMAVDTNHKQLSSDAHLGGITLQDMDDDFMMPMFIAMDPPKHTVQRKTVQPTVGPQQLKRYEDLIRQRTQFVLDDLPHDEPFDWVDKVSVELTTMMLATLFDFPFEDRRKLTRWSDVTVNRENPDICPGGEDQWRMELLECLQYFQGLWDERVKRDEPGNDFISMLAHSPETRDMPPMEYLGNLLLLIVGGNDTTRNTMTSSILCLNNFPGEYDKLKANHGLIPSMVSETIRWQTPLAHMRRTALEDVELAGKTIRKGDKVAMWYLSGNRDERHFERPDDYIIDRPNVRSHLAFGFGIHRCVGNRLAELQLRILWEEVFKRYEHIEVLDEPSRTANAFVHGYTWMPVRLHAR